MMKIKVGVRCEYWNRPEYEEIEVADDATEDEIDAAMYEVAMAISKLEWWQE